MGKRFSGILDLADDGKRLDALDVVYGAGGCLRGGSLREGSGSPIGADGDLADDGKRFDALDVAFQGRRLCRGGSLREGSGWPVLDCPRPGGVSVFGVLLS